MKKFVTMMVMVIMMLMAAVGMAESATLMPKINLNDLENTVYGDGYDLHISMYMSMPEYEYVRLEINVSFNDNKWQNYNAGKATLYDGNTGEFIDEINGNLCADVDCSSKDIETVRRNMLTYIEEYDFEADAEKGVRYYSIWF